MLLEHRIPTWEMGEGFLEKEVKILCQIFLCYPFSQFLPDDDEAASMFTVVIDKEITQLEKKKKTSATGRVCFCCEDIYSQCKTSMLEKDFRALQMCATFMIEEMFTFELVLSVFRQRQCKMLGTFSGTRSR